MWEVVRDKEVHALTSMSMPDNAINWTEVDVEHTARMILSIVITNNSTFTFTDLYKPGLSIRQLVHSMIHSAIQFRIPRPE